MTSIYVPPVSVRRAATPVRAPVVAPDVSRHVTGNGPSLRGVADMVDAALSVPAVLRQAPSLDGRFADGVASIAALCDRTDHHVKKFAGLRSGGPATTERVGAWISLVDILHRGAEVRWRDCIAWQSRDHKPFFRRLHASWRAGVQDLLRTADVLRARIAGKNVVDEATLRFMDETAFAFVPIRGSRQGIRYRVGLSRTAIAEEFLAAFARVSASYASDCDGVSFIVREDEVTETLICDFPFAWPAYPEHDPYLAAILAILKWEITTTVGREHVITHLTYAPPTRG